MRDRIVVVTGAAGEIGRATVDAFRADGWFVVGVDQRSGAAGDKSIAADLADPDAITSIEGAMSDFDSLSGLVNNAGVSRGTSLLGTTPSQWDATMAINARAAHVLTQTLHKHLRNGGGAIVNVSSVHALATTTGASAYAASKAALVAYTRAAAIELADDGIRVNAVLPGAVDTPMLLHGTEGEERHQRIGSLESRTPLRRVGRPEEIAQAILFLADNERSAFITGQTLVVDGGAMALLSTE